MDASAISNFDRERPDLTFISATRLTCGKIIDPVVKWTGHSAVMHNAFAQRTALVRTTVLNRIDALIGCSENRDLQPLLFHTT